MSEHPDHCALCDLIQGSTQASVCYEDADAVAFMEMQPVNTGHVVVVPRVHYNSLLDVPADVGTHLLDVSMRLVGAIRRVTQCEDINIIVDGGAAAGQSEPHYRVHVIPRRTGDGFRVDLPFSGSRTPDHAMLEATAVQLVAAMRNPVRPSSVDDAETLEIPARELAAIAAETGEQPANAGQSAKEKTAPLEREVVVLHARDGVTSGDPNHRGAWRLEEGAHGELIYDVRDRL